MATSYELQYPVTQATVTTAFDPNSTHTSQKDDINRTQSLHPNRLPSSKHHPSDYNPYDERWLSYNPHVERRSSSTPDVRETVADLSREKLSVENTRTEAEGGVRGWMTIAGGWLVLFATFGTVYSFGVYEEFYVFRYLPNHTSSSIAWIGSFQLMMPYLLGIVSGKLFDNGYFHHLEIVGGLLFTFSLFMLSLAKPLQYYQIFLSQGLGMGIGAGLIFVPTISVTSHHFAKRRALAMGILLTGISAGSTIFPIMLNHLIPKIGFGPAVRASGYIVLPFSIVGNLLMRTGPLRSKRAPPDLKSFFRDVPYLWAILGSLLSTFGVYMPLIYVQLYAVQHSVGANLAFYSIAIMNGTSAFGRVAANYLADIYSPFGLQVFCTLGTAATIWAVLGIHDSGSLIVVSIFYGIFSGAWLALSLACLASLARTPDEVGARAGIALAFASFGSLGAAPIQGALLTRHFHWVRAVTFAATIVMASAVCFVFMTILIRRRSS
ncbi:MFS general substrate transporter [Mycena indigotica]|uniref:MFS general substrate transporter n=1 Tax=Mycena indigotica TaxID=2126181 RepID=A0A8H6W7N9_9AGAR|nr:MFS general substrate transporter [Mycena indigotica]KAF7302289.1 MFS general substrate transporter [Mycena indigotica]